MNNKSEIDTPELARATPSRWLKPVLFVSLALNLLVLGAIVAMSWHQRNDNRLPGGTTIQFIPRNFVADLPASRKKQVRDILQNFRQDIKSGRQTSQQAVMQLAQAIAQDPYNPQAVNEALKAVQSSHMQLGETGSAATLAVINQLTPEERKNLSNALKARNSSRDYKERREREGHAQ